MQILRVDGRAAFSVTGLGVSSIIPLLFSWSFTAITTILKVRWLYIFLKSWRKPECLNLSLYAKHCTGLPWWLAGKESTCQRKRCRFDPWVEKIPPEKEMATHSSILAWRIPGTEEPGGLQSMGSQRVGHDGATKPPPSGVLKHCKS